MDRLDIDSFREFGEILQRKYDAERVARLALDMAEFTWMYGSGDGSSEGPAYGGATVERVLNWKRDVGLL